MKRPKIAKTAVDRLIENVSPNWALKRYEARHRIASRFEIAQPSRERDTHDDPLIETETPDHQWDRYRVIQEVRHQWDNFAPITGACETVVTHCVPLGWYSTYPDREAAMILTRYIQDSLEAEAFDLAQRHDGLSMFALSIKDGLVDGDNGWHHFSHKGESVSWVQAVRGHRIGDPTRVQGFHPFEHQKRKYYHVAGLNVDEKTSRVVSYEIFRERSNGFGFMLDQVIPSQRFFHYFDPSHLDSYRGVPPFHCCLKEADDLKTIWDYQRSQMKAASSIGGVIKREGGTARPGDSDIDLEDTTGPDKTEFRQAYMRVRQTVFKYLEPGESIEQFKQENPGGQFWEFVKWLMSTYSFSLALPYSFLYDAGGTSGAPLRFEVNRGSQRLQRLRRNGIRRLLNPWMRRKIAEGLFNGSLPLRVAEYANYIQGQWTFAKDPTADAAREGKVHLEEAKLAVRSFGSVSELLGQGNFASVIGSKEQEAAIVFEAVSRLHEKFPAIPVQMLKDHIQTIFPNQSNAAEPETPEDDAPGSVASD